jgi:hypothetical protein
VQPEHDVLLILKPRVVHAPYAPVMGLGEALRALDNRVLGKPKHLTAAESAAMHRKTFLVGSAGTSVVLAAVALGGWWSAAGAVSGFAGMAVIGGARWYLAARRVHHG